MKSTLPLAFIHSHYRNVYQNLALERILFKQLNRLPADGNNEPPRDVLVSYINKPCLVLGRFQNYWHEVILKG